MRDWTKIKVSSDGTCFVGYDGDERPMFDRGFIEVLKFHHPGLAAVLDLSGAYHIDAQGRDLYSQRYMRTFGYYFDRAAVVQQSYWFHIRPDGSRAYPSDFNWVGNFQENLCTVRTANNEYYHIDMLGNKQYEQRYIYAGDFKDGHACVCDREGYYHHIDINGYRLHDKEFLDLGIYHKSVATARDKSGWFHIDKKGEQLYPNRYLQVEPYYNGQARVTTPDGNHVIINESGDILLQL